MGASGAVVVGVAADTLHQLVHRFLRGAGNERPHHQFAEADATLHRPRQDRTDHRRCGWVHHCISVHPPVSVEHPHCAFCLTAWGGGVQFVSQGMLDQLQDTGKGI